jgi:HAMP domain-containing protein
MSLDEPSSLTQRPAAAPAAPGEATAPPCVAAGADAVSDADMDADATRLMPAAKRGTSAPATQATDLPSRVDPAATGVAAATDASAPGDDPAATVVAGTLGSIRAAGTLPGTLPPGAPPELRQVGRYVIHECLGRGGMATVFRAHDPDIGRDVAIKFLHAALNEDQEYRARFLREARAAGGLSHPNIVTVYDVGEIDGRPYMAMELIDGVPLADELSDGKPLPVRDVVVMGIQLARALAYAHARGIVHRDIKPGNLMRLKGTQTIKVTDFGIAHVESVGAGHRTRVGDILGTPQYMSPEQAQGDRLDGRSDLFSAGILLYQMLAGQRPFPGDSLVALAVKIAREDPVPIERLRPDLPASLRRVVERCLAKAPDRRFQTGQELSDALGRVLIEIDENELEKGKRRMVPLRLKWAAAMASIVAVVMALTAAVITQRQYAAMVAQVVDSGAALARFIAAQNAVAVLSDDWVAVDASLQEIMKTGDFQSVAVIDRQDIVRASGRPEQVGQRHQPPPAAAALSVQHAAASATRHVVDGETVLGFEAPITFQSKVLGRVALGLREKPLVQVARLSKVLMAVLVLVTVLAVAVATYFVVHWFARPIRLVSDSMGEIAKGRFDYRIREQRKDEFGDLYTAFDRMAQALQDRQSGAAVAAPSTPAPRSGPGGPVAKDV